jgi:cyclic pyranopterin monophosphate synthase
MARVLSVNLSDKKGVAKQPAASIALKEEHGVLGDAHAGPGDRQVSLLAIESYRRHDQLRTLCLKHGSFGENILTEGIELHTLAIGTRLSINDTILEISKIGKECHAPCQIAKTVGRCVMPTEGIFARVLKQGSIVAGDSVVITK